MTTHEPPNPDPAGDDSEPRSELAERVSAMLGRRVHNLRVEFDGRGLVLRGRAESYHAKQLAQHVVMTVAGLPLSANNIVVTYLRGKPPRPGGEDAPAPEPVPHTAEPVTHTIRATATPDAASAAPGADRFLG